MSRRLAAIVAIGAGVAAAGAGLFVFVDEFPLGLLVFACVLGAFGAAWLALLRRGVVRWIAALVVALLIAGGAVAVASGDNHGVLAIVGVALAVGVLSARSAFQPQRRLPSAPPPRHPVLFVNPRSGDGRAGREGLVEAARERGLETVVLEPGQDLEELVRAAVGRGADGLAMAGGDGSQALVAAIAAEHDLPYACIPSGTRNHFALDLGVDREDAVGALDAFGEGGERYVDLGEVNGQVFVNNVSLGVYASAVSQDEYRGAKTRTLLDTLTDTLGPGGEPDELRWVDGDGEPQTSTALILISNNVYRLGPTLGSGTRPRLDEGVLGIVDFHPPIPGEASQRARWRELKAPELEIESDAPVPVGVDGESVTLEGPLRFRIRPKALRVRIAHDHPGASPSAQAPAGLVGGVRALLRIAGRTEPEDFQPGRSAG
jgi:diacylglycerol kinase family enzyme